MGPGRASLAGHLRVVGEGELGAATGVIAGDGIEIRGVKDV